jgi:hypothetical protein
MYNSVRASTTLLTDFVVESGICCNKLLLSAQDKFGVTRVCRPSVSIHGAEQKCYQTCTRTVQEVSRYEKSMSQDYRLNWRLRNDCRQDAEVLCPDACRTSVGNACGGLMLRCLMDNKEKLKKEACRQEVFYFIRMDVCLISLSDFANHIGALLSLKLHIGNVPL